MSNYRGPSRGYRSNNRYRDELEAAQRAANSNRRTSQRQVPARSKNQYPTLAERAQQRQQERINQQRRSSPNRRRRTKRRPRYRLKLRAKILIGLLLLLLVVLMARCTFTKNEPERIVGQSQQTGTEVNPLDRELRSDAAILIDAANQKVLYQKNADDKEYPASLTKMMTLYVALENNKDLDRVVTVPNAAFNSLSEKDAATAGLIPGETVPFKDLLYAMILPSGADAAKSIALITSGSEEDFVQKMNDTAKELGMKNTYFTNVTGLSNPKQVTSAADLGKFLLEAMKNQSFQEILTTYQYTTSPSAQHADGIDLSHTISKNLEEFKSLFNGKSYEIIGGKTGFTTEAGLCLASVAKSSNGDTVIAVTLHALGDANNYYPVFKDAATLYDYAFETK